MTWIIIICLAALLLNIMIIASIMRRDVAGKFNNAEKEPPGKSVFISKKQYGILLLLTGKNKYNDRKRKKYERNN